MSAGASPDQLLDPQEDVAVGRSIRRLALVLALIGFAAAYAPTIWTLVRVWRFNPNYSHGFLIAPVTAFLIWRQREQLRRDVSPAGTWAGLALLLPAAALQIIGIRGNVAMVQGVSLILAVSGITLHLYGFRVLYRCAFPLAFLLFMIPTLPWFIDVVSFQLKVGAARGAVAIAHLIGVAVIREGVNLHFTDGVLAVENACSGLRSLMALLALGALFAYWAKGPLWARLLLFALSLPIAVIANLIRVSALCVYAGLSGVDKAAGAFHDVGGYVLFALAFLLLSGCKRILRC